MKLPAARVAAFLRRPDREIHAVLLYGPDAGLVSERADVVARTVCPDLKDPFRVAHLNGAALAADPARLADEAAQMSLIGGRRGVRVRDAADRPAALLARLSVGDSAEIELDDAVMAAAEGDAARVDRVLGKVFQEGESAVSVTRAMLRHLHRLHVLAARLAAGSTLAEVMSSARPPIFFK